MMRTWILLAMHVVLTVCFGLAGVDRVERVSHMNVPGLEICEPDENGQLEGACIDRNDRRIKEYVLKAPPIQKSPEQAGVVQLLTAVLGSLIVFSFAIRTHSRLRSYFSVLAAYTLLSAVQVFGMLEFGIIAGISILVFAVDELRRSTARGDKN